VRREPCGDKRSRNGEREPSLFKQFFLKRGREGAHLNYVREWFTPSIHPQFAGTIEVGQTGTTGFGAILAKATCALERWALKLYFSQ